MTFHTKGTKARWTGFLPPTLLVLATLMGGPLAAAEEPDPSLPLYDAEIEMVDSWTAGGASIMFRVSPDGSRLLVSGYGGASDLRVMDRSGDTLSVLDLPGENATVKGILWTEGNTWLTAWGNSQGSDTDFFATWDADTYEPTDEVFENTTAPLPVVDAAYFMTNDYIVGLAGRDVNGTSRVLVMEATDHNVRADIPWKDNATVLFMGTDGNRILCVDELGAVTLIESRSWNIENRLEGFEGRPTSASFANSWGRDPWILGYQDGSTFYWVCCPWQPAGNGSHGTGPVLALTWIEHTRGEFYVVATPREGGSAVSVHRWYYGLDQNDRISPVLLTDGAVTSMAADPAVPGQVWAGFSDGTLALLNVTLTADHPPDVRITKPKPDTTFWEETVSFRGNVSDDHDNITWVKVRVDDGEWQDVEWADGEWWFEHDVTGMEQEGYNLTVKTFDGRTESAEWIIVFDVGQPSGDDGSSSTFWYWFAGGALMVAVLVGVLHLRRQGRS